MGEQLLRNICKLSSKARYQILPLLADDIIARNQNVSKTDTLENNVLNSANSLGHSAASILFRTHESDTFLADASKTGQIGMDQLKAAKVLAERYSNFLISAKIAKKEGRINEAIKYMSSLFECNPYIFISFLYDVDQTFNSDELNAVLEPWYDRSKESHDNLIIKAFIAFRQKDEDTVKAMYEESRQRMAATEAEILNPYDYHSELRTVKEKHATLCAFIGKHEESIRLLPHTINSHFIFHKLLADTLETLPDKEKIIKYILGAPFLNLLGSAKRFKMIGNHDAANECFNLFLQSLEDKLALDYAFEVAQEEGLLDNAKTYYQIVTDLYKRGHI